MEGSTDELELYRRRVKVRQHTLRRLGVTSTRCICGETDPVCFEADHIYRREYDGACWGICCNCHRKRTARGWSEHPRVGLIPEDPFERAGHMLLGASDYLDFISGHLRASSHLMFKLGGMNLDLGD